MLLYIVCMQSNCGKSNVNRLWIIYQLLVSMETNRPSRKHECLSDYFATCGIVEFATIKGKFLACVPECGWNTIPATTTLKESSLRMYLNLRGTQYFSYHHKLVEGRCQTRVYLPWIAVHMFTCCSHACH